LFWGKTSGENENFLMTKSDPLHIAFCVNERYARYLCVPINGLLSNNRCPIVIHVLSDYLSSKSIRRLRTLTDSRKDVELDVITVDDSKLRGLKDTWTIYTWYRVLLPDILETNVHKVLYLDADVAVVDDLEELFQLDMTEKAIAGTVDFQSKDGSTYQRCGYEMEKQYVCAGVLLMNLDYWREHDIANQVVRWGRENNDRIRFPDQDSINYICRDAKVLLPLKYGIVDGFFHDDYYYRNYPQELRECVESPAIIHYAGQAPWVVELSHHLLQDEWEKYNRMLPFPVKKTYLTKGFAWVKMHIWNLLYPHRKKPLLSRSDVLNQLK